MFKDKFVLGAQNTVQAGAVARLYCARSAVNTNSVMVNKEVEEIQMGGQ
jgi:hypothetical protein